MKIVLFLDDRLIEFKLPMEVSGDFSFDFEDVDSKLINVKAQDGKWFLYGTSDVTVLDNNVEVSGRELELYKYYVLKRDNKSYRIFVTTLFDKMFSFEYKDKLNIVFGNTNKSTIKFYNSNLTTDILTITNQNEIIVLNNVGNAKLYINDYAVNEPSIKINYGDRITYFNFNIVVLKNIIMFNNPNYSNNQPFIDENMAGISKINDFDISELYKGEIKDTDLYSENDYFSKSPRLKRFITEKEVKLDPPPKGDNGDDMPLIMVIGPMLTMAITSMTMLLNTLLRISDGTTTVKDSWPQLVTSGAMMLSTLLWPIITKLYTKNRKKKKALELEEKYNKYIDNNKKIFDAQSKLQHDILMENMVSLSECEENIKKRGVLFWNKRNDDKDFLTLRVGYGNAKLDVKVEWPEEGFTVDEDKLREKMEKLISDYEYVQNVPIGYSLYDNKITAVMGDKDKCVSFVNNLILQLLTFYSYEDIKLVVFTNKNYEKRWSYIKYLNHNFSNDKAVRFFATDNEGVKRLNELFLLIARQRMNSKNDDPWKPYYIFIIDDYEMVKQTDFIKEISESKENLGFSMIILEDKLAKLPSKCNSFISIVGQGADILINSSDSQEHIKFKEEINYNINMMDYAKILSNIPVEFEDGIKELPDTISFLEMEKVGNVSQLNVLNRWNTLDPISSLKAEVGVDEHGDLLYLDLHEKFHGPHGLIAGTTGSGKSEFIITYILSMAINYSPEYVSFILIDYKGGGLAGAFENKVTGISLPHLAGTITNLDKAEMDRTLVSIDSEVKRRQAMFNKARDQLGESTIDIYKYQRFYRDGKVSEPIPHLFIICDEFAELKAQQPDFMDNLISVARIGRSLGVHLILATQKPSGVVNDQIWSNTKFRVCLKVADEADSKEMLKRPEAAYIKQTGRFYLQVGMNELFELGQSAWCGAKYFPSDKVIKQVDKSVDFINDSGEFIKSIQAANSKGAAAGEQIAAVMGEVIKLASQTGKKAKKLWLENIPPIILVDDIAKKYNVQAQEYEFKAIIGEYDAPEKQEQGILVYDYLNQGNTIIYGLDSSERELFLNSILYSTMMNHSPEEVNFYILDYGSESLRKFSKFPQMGGMVFAGDDEKYKNLFELIKNELKERKKLFADYGGEYENYIKNSGKKLPLKVIIFNNYDSIYENNQTLYDTLPDIVRDSERYGFVFILTANNVNSVNNRISQNFDNIYTFKLKDITDYTTAFGTRKKIEPRDTFGRGLVNNDGVHEFQTCNIIENVDDLNDYLMEKANELNSKYQTRAERIPELPKKVTYDIVAKDIKGLASIPVGMSKDKLNVVSFDFTSSIGTLLTSYKLRNMMDFVYSLVFEFTKVSNLNVLFIDGTEKMKNIGQLVSNYYNNNFDSLLGKIEEYLDNVKNSNSNSSQIVMIYGFDKFMSKLGNSQEFNKFIDKIKATENCRIIIMDDSVKLKQYSFEAWFTKTFSGSDGIWVGKGFAEQNIFKTGVVKKEYLQEVKNDMGFVINEGIVSQIKFIDFTEKGKDDVNEE